MGQLRTLASRSGAASLLAAFLVVACAGGQGPTSARTVAFDDIASAATSRHDGGPTLVVGTSDQARARIATLRPGLTLPDGVGLVAVFQGQRRTGGFAIRVTRIERDGDRLVVRAIFAKPLDNAFVTQALTSPVHIVSIGSSALSGVRQAVLLDDTGGGARACGPHLIASTSCSFTSRVLEDVSSAAGAILRA